MDYTCACNSSYTGKNCDVFIPCSTDPCLFNSTCENFADYSDYTCHCSENYIGRHCDVVSTCQTVEPCINDGQCTDLASYNETLNFDLLGQPFIEKISDYECTCSFNFNGTNCEVCADLYRMFYETKV